MPIGAQNIEKNYSIKEISQMSGDQLLVRHIWYTIQGEGPFAGYPAVFVRLGGCNRGAKLDCIYCDTDFLVSRSTLMGVGAVVAEVQKSAPVNWDQPLVVITGGEPLMHDNVELLVEALHQEGFQTQIESNGDFVRPGKVRKSVLVVSPKIVGRTGKYATPPAGMLARADYLKILVSANPNNPYHNLPEYVHDFAQCVGSTHVFISPINEYQREVKPGELASMWGDMYDPVECAANHQYAARLVQDHCFRLSLQMHAYVAVP